MEKYIDLKLIAIITLIFFVGESFAQSPSGDVKVVKNKNAIVNDVSVETWGSYKVHNFLFPEEEWEFFIIVVPKNTNQESLIKIAKKFYKQYPNTRARFFSDTKNIQQFVDRDIFFNDKTGKVKEVNFPDEKWVQAHLLGNINNRSVTYNRHWMLEDRYGVKLALLP